MANTCGSLDTSRILLTTHDVLLSVICGVEVYPVLSFWRCWMVEVLFGIQESKGGSNNSNASTVPDRDVFRLFICLM